MILALAAELPLSGQTNQEGTLTHGLVNCRFWRVAPFDGRVMYLSGFAEGLALGSGAKNHVYWPDNTFSSGDMESAVAAFCQTPENVNVAVMLAMRIVTARVSGSSPAEIEDMIANARRVSAQPLPSEQQPPANKPAGNSDNSH